MKRKQRQWHFRLWILAALALAAIIYYSLADRPVQKANQNIPQLSKSVEY